MFFLLALSFSLGVKTIAQVFSLICLEICFEYSMVGKQGVLADSLKITCGGILWGPTECLLMKVQKH